MHPGTQFPQYKSRDNSPPTGAREDERNSDIRIVSELLSQLPEEHPASVSPIDRHSRVEELLRTLLAEGNDVVLESESQDLVDRVQAVEWLSVCVDFIATNRLNGSETEISYTSSERFKATTHTSSLSIG